jgi:hypothetical protein
MNKLSAGLRQGVITPPRQCGDSDIEGFRWGRFPTCPFYFLNDTGALILTGLGFTSVLPITGEKK